MMFCWVGESILVGLLALYRIGCLVSLEIKPLVMDIHPCKPSMGETGSNGDEARGITHQASMLGNSQVQILLSPLSLMRYVTLIIGLTNHFRCVRL